MKTSLRGFALAAVAGLAVLVLAQTPVHAQYRRLPVRPAPVTPAVPVFPTTTPRMPVTVPSIQGFTNPNVLPVMTLNQLATLDVLSMDPTFMMNLRLYNASRRPIIVTPTYPIYPYGVPYGVTPTGLPYSPFNYYNPYFGAYGLYP
jgi:hypothetical protein